MVKQPAQRASSESAAIVGPTSTLAIGVSHGAVTITVRVTPRASREALTIEEGQLRVRLRAAPVDGAANAALVALLAERLKLPRRAITIVQGETARIKRIAIADVTEDDLRQRLASAINSPGGSNVAR